MTEIEEKGAALRSTLGAIRDELGAEVLEKVLLALPESDFREAAKSGRVLAASWYPIRHRRELYVALGRVAPQERGLPRRISARATTEDMRGIYAFIVKLVTPTTLATYAPRVVATYFRGPSVSTEHIERGLVRFRFERFVGFDAALWEDMLSGCETILRIAGLSEVRSEIAEGGGRNPEALVSFCWK